MSKRNSQSVTCTEPSRSIRNSTFMQRVTHGIKRGQLEIGPRTAIYSFALVVGLTLVAALYLILVSQTAACGRHIEQLQEELVCLQRETGQLEVRIAREGSVSRLRERAVEMDFVPAERVEYLLLAAGE